MPAFLAWLIPALVSAASTWYASHQRNRAQGFQDTQAQRAWEEQEKRRQMLGASVMDLLERRPEFRDRIPGPLLDWITRPARPFTGQSYMPSPLAAGAVGGAAAGASAWQEGNRQEAARGPVGGIPSFGSGPGFSASSGPGFSTSEEAFSIDAPLSGWSSGQSAMSQAGPDTSSDEFQTIPNLVGGATFGGSTPTPTSQPSPEGVTNEEEGTFFSSLPETPGLSRFLADYFRRGAGP